MGADSCFYLSRPKASGGLVFIQGGAPSRFCCFHLVFSIPSARRWPDLHVESNGATRNAS